MSPEDHGVVGGIGSAVAEALSETGIPVRRHEVRTFGESGSAEALYAKHGLDARGIAEAARGFVSDFSPSLRRSG